MVIAGIYPGMSPCLMLTEVPPGVTEITSPCSAYLRVLGFDSHPQTPAIANTATATRATNRLTGFILVFLLVGARARTNALYKAMFADIRLREHWLPRAALLSIFEAVPNLHKNLPRI